MGLVIIDGSEIEVADHERLNGIQAARRAVGPDTSAGTVAPLAAGLTAVRTLRRDLPGMGLGDDARFEIDFRLAQKESQFIAALVAATDLRVGVFTPNERAAATT